MARARARAASREASDVERSSSPGGATRLVTAPLLLRAPLPPPEVMRALAEVKMPDGVKTRALSDAAADSPVPPAAAAAARPPTPRGPPPAAPSSSADGGSPLPGAPWVNRMLALPRAVRL